MSETLYVQVTWTAGDTITEAKMDNMVANDRAVDAMNNGMRLSERAAPATPPANTLHLFAKDDAGISALFFIDDAGTVQQLTETAPVFVFPIGGALVTGTSLTSILIVPKTLTITKAYIAAKIGPIGAAVIADIKKNGVSIWNATPANRVRIADGALSGITSSFDTTALTEGDILSADISQVGSTTPGSDATIELKTK